MAQMQGMGTGTGTGTGAGASTPPSSWKPTTKTVVGTIAGGIAAPLSIIVCWLINGLGWGCWADPQAAAVACKTSMPNGVQGAFSAVIGVVCVGLALWVSPRDSGGNVK